ncbi:MBL fold metallo-hydrolase [uncultured Vibrio sp.]|uniref:MBL fold metallo-hydrolase n=1 Tax=uncultured Vibrio sp. TaxID=114054 RepID=UPI0025D3B624|nr:MBL fold metallo-hydrolase [uncultured Vibrio sp.]
MTIAISATMASEQEDNKFVNSEIRHQTDLANIWSIAKAYFKTERKAASPSKEIPVVPMTIQQLSEPHDAIYRLGHSTLLMRLNGQLILTDPVFSDRASPVQWAGPKRFHESPISIADLPAIDAVIISHDHYDHLDKASVKQLQEKVGTFITPLKVGQRLIDWGIPKDKVVELDWWEKTEVEGITIVATPSQHFSGRGLLDSDQTLWASWVIKSDAQSLFFSGDSGYFGGFKEIGERYGPFDVTFMETGAYNALWKDIHMMPEETMQAHRDLKGRYLLPIHNGTFDLSLHDWYEPFERIVALGDQYNVPILTPTFGQEIPLEAMVTSDESREPNASDHSTEQTTLTTPHWWKPFMVAN